MFSCYGIPNYFLVTGKKSYTRVTICTWENKEDENPQIIIQLAYHSIGPSTFKVLFV